MADLMKLVALGPKVTGSYECDVHAVRIIRQEVAVIAQTMHPVHLLQQDLQKPKGAFHMKFKPYGFQSVYDKIQNIAVRLGPKKPSNHSILVNCHYDTVPESPGKIFSFLLLRVREAFCSRRRPHSEPNDQ